MVCQLLMRMESREVAWPSLSSLLQNRMFRKPETIGGRPMKKMMYTDMVMVIFEPIRIGKPIIRSTPTPIAA